MIFMDPRATAQGPPSPDAASAKMMIRQDDGARGAAGARNSFAGVLSRQAAGAEGAEDIAATPGSGPLAPDPSGEADADTPTQVPETTPVPGKGARLPSGDGPDETPVAGPGPATPDAKTSRPVEQGNGMQPVAGGDTPRLTAGIFPRQGGAARSGRPGPYAWHRRADLLRRHIDSLAREFAALGYGDVGFHFEGESREDRPGGQGGSAPDPAPTEETDPKPPRRTLVIGGGLDLKLFDQRHGNRADAPPDRHRRPAGHRLRKDRNPRDGDQFGF